MSHVAGRCRSAGRQRQAGLFMLVVHACGVVVGEVGRAGVIHIDSVSLFFIYIYIYIYI